MASLWLEGRGWAHSRSWCLWSDSRVSRGLLPLSVASGPARGLCSRVISLLTQKLRASRTQGRSCQASQGLGLPLAQDHFFWTVSVSSPRPAQIQEAGKRAPSLTGGSVEDGFRGASFIQHTWTRMDTHTSARAP